MTMVLVVTPSDDSGCDNVVSECGGSDIVMLVAMIVMMMTTMVMLTMVWW